MRELIFEKVGDIHSTYPYLCVYLQGEIEPFMEIAVTEERNLAFTLYPREFSVVLSVEELTEILNRASLFLPKALENNDSE
ncbi:hypothetical protein [Pseudomonas sp. MGal98]|uniref:hypothetical protein n=1 Tax=Pseudomonas sp. MGal98 TaxID=3162460 RepID=UPI0032EB4F72